MNDPGLDDRIENDAADVENQNGEEQSGKDRNEQTYLEPSRWWFASTAFPLVAGTFGPMGSAFSICALVVPWRVYIPPGGAAEQNGTDVPDPKWLVSVNALQLVIALISNLFLLLNMAKRVRFSIAQPITIIGWYISSIALICLCSMASGPLILEPRERYAFTGAFYYAIFSAGIYFIVATLMLVTVYGASKGHYAKEFQLTMSQRTLMLQTISFLVYLLSGAAVFRKLEGWTYLEAVYWANFTLLTIGIGDYAPMTHTGRGLLMPYAIGGIIILGLVIGSIRSLVLDRGKIKLGARMIEKERRRILNKLIESDEAELSRIAEKGTGLMPIGGKISSKDLQKKREDLQRQEQEFLVMRHVQAQAASKRRWTSLVISGITWFALWFIGAAVFHTTEKNQQWTYFGSLYFAYTSLLTIGYGDFRPQSNSGKAFFVLWTLLAVPSLTILISNMGDTIIKGIRDLTLWLGNVTVLPGEKNKKDVLGITNTITARVFGDRLTRSRNNRRDTPDNNNQTSKNGAEDLDRKSRGNENSKETDFIRYRQQLEEDVQKGNIQYHLLLVKEIADIITHVNAKPAREYTYDEWAWYLKLAGEEDTTEIPSHRNNEGRLVAESEENNQGQVDGKSETAEQREKAAWSWLSQTSPLMGDKGEAQWILDKLTMRLQQELESAIEAQSR